MKATSGQSYKGVELRVVTARSDRAGKSPPEATLLSTIQESLTVRFGDISLGVLAATKLASFKNWPDPQNAAALEDFGETEVDALCAHFQPVLNSSDVCVELIPDQRLILKTKIYAEQENLQNLSWSEVNRKHGELCPDVLDLMDLVMSIPVSTADCERGFNTMKQVKTDWRSKLTSASLTDLLMVQLSSPEIRNYDPSTAIDLWWNTETIYQRRPNFMTEGNSFEGNSDSDRD
ncbi:Zinc finger protein 862 [Merluccius polli]|uniref:Zinc finger protein 862 n=1 Tax=Merluccius polli TaxID=89951 RepID=A0AA47M7D7_MERPO|nr:Zinc finger protein 862 [Merluccius polli]